MVARGGLQGRGRRGDIRCRALLRLEREVERVELLITFANALGPTIFPIPAPSETGAQTLTYTMPLSGDGHLLPNTPLRYRWRVDGTASRETRFVYADDRFDWKTREGPIVRVHWYEGDAGFGQRALKIGEDAVEASSELLGVTETEPVDFFIYARQDAFRDALGQPVQERLTADYYNSAAVAPLQQENRQ